MMIVISLDSHTHWQFNRGFFKFLNAKGDPLKYFIHIDLYVSNFPKLD